jgi:hypothetical protein
VKRLSYEYRDYKGMKYNPSFEKYSTTEGSGCNISTECHITDYLG